jgi:hypothetical protein
VFIEGLHNFSDVAQANIQNGFMCCPYVDYENKKEYSSWKILHSHLLRKGFMPSYNCWTKHGERGVMMEDSEEEEDDDMYPEYGDAAIGEAEDEGIGEAKDEEASHEPADDLRRAIIDAHIEAESVNEKRKLKWHVRRSQKKVVPKLRRWQHKAQYHTVISAMEGKDWFI